MERAQSDSLDAIRTDLERTFADMPMVTPWRPQISRLLQQYAMDNPDVGYTQGMNYVAAAMVLKSPEREDLVRRRFAEAMLQFSGFWSPGFPLLNFGVSLFVRLVERHLQAKSPASDGIRQQPLAEVPCHHVGSSGGFAPEGDWNGPTFAGKALWGHLLRNEVEPLSFLPNGWLSLFGKWLPLPAVMEAMDLILECGVRGVLAVTLAFLQMQQSRLLAANSMEEILELINQDSRTSPLDGELLVECSRRWLPCVDEALQTRLA